MPADALEDRLGLLIKQAEQAMMAAKAAALRPHGLTVPQYSALLFLEREPGLSAAALARRVLVTPQTMGPLLDGLEQRGLVERRPHPVHRRVVELFPTAAGRALLRKADRAAVAVETALESQLSERERRTIRTLLQRAIAGLREDARDAA